MPQRATAFGGASGTFLLRSYRNDRWMWSFGHYPQAPPHHGLSCEPPLLPFWVGLVSAPKAFLFVYLAPRNAGVALLWAYRFLISPLYGDVCRYYPSCSHYSLIAVGQRGLVMGTWLTARRLVRCHPWAAGGIDDVPPPRHQHFTVHPSGFVSP
jgi:putative membrane protein insertion efficiency factor